MFVHVSRDVLLRMCLALAGALAACLPPSFPSLVPCLLPSLLTTCSLCAHSATAGGESYTDVVRRLEPILVEIERMLPCSAPRPHSLTPWLRAPQAPVFSRSMLRAAVC